MGIEFLGVGEEIEYDIRESARNKRCNGIIFEVEINISKFSKNIVYHVTNSITDEKEFVDGETFKTL